MPKISEIFIEKWFKAACIVNVLLCIIFIFLFSPVTSEGKGDQGTYMTMASQIFSKDGLSVCFSHRSPLYPMLLGVFSLVFGSAYYIKTAIIFQYFLVFLTSLVIYRLFEMPGTGKRNSFFVSLLFVLNFSTIFYAYNILSEILTVCLFFLSFYLLMLFSRHEKSKYLLMSGALSGFLILARFNMLPLPFFFGLIIMLFFLQKYHFILNFKILFRWLIVFFAPIIIILNLWCAYNFFNHGKYFLFPASHMGNRYTVTALIKNDQHVTEEYKDVHKIFLNVKEKYLAEKEKSFGTKKSSLLNYMGKDFYLHFAELTSGYQVYLMAKDELHNYYQIDTAQAGYDDLLSRKLGPYYDQVIKQNKSMLWELRLFSLINSFKYSYSGEGDFSKNLGKLPSTVVFAYKFIFETAIILFVLLAIIYIYIAFKKHLLIKNFIALSVLIIIFYFPVINVLAVTYSDANRFKFPSEPLILGMIFYMFTFIKHYRKQKKLKKETPKT
ncbi:MAG: hypothetical protein V1904_09915 [Bacteroidota bacterium]